MANAVSIRIDITGAPDQVQRTARLIGTPQRPVDFEVAVPELRRDAPAVRGDEPEGTYNPEDWANTHWGVRDNVRGDEVSLGQRPLGAGSTCLSLAFSSRWEPPLEWFAAVCRQARTLELGVHLRLVAYEPGMQDAWELSWTPGQIPVHGYHAVHHSGKEGRRFGEKHGLDR